VTARRVVHLVLALGASPAIAQRPPTIDTVMVETLPVFDGPSDSLAWYERAANGVRVTTRQWIVRRELLFAAGEPYDSARVAESARQLRALGVFRSVDIDSLRIDGQLAVRVRTGDGWSTRPTLNFRSAGSEFILSAGLAEQNFLGTATRARALYQHTPDRDALRLGLLNPHTLGSSVETEVEYERLSDGERGGIRVQPHHVPLSARHAFGVVGEIGTTTLLQFREAELAATFRRRVTLAGGSVGWAPHADSRGYVRLFASAQIRREDIVPDTVATVPRTVTGAVGLGLEFRHARFLLTERYNSFGQREDVDLSTVLSGELRVAPQAFGYEHTVAGPAGYAQTGGMWRGGFFRLAVQGHALFRGTAIDSGRVVGSGTVVVRVLPRQTLILAGRVGVAKDPVPSEEFDLGLGEGPRGFGTHAFTGTRMAWVTLEHRVFLIDEWLRLLGIGVAAFADYGGAWFAGDSERFGGSVGLGLRFGSPRSTRGSMGRVDLAYTFGDGAEGGRWALVLGRSQFF